MTTVNNQIPTPSSLDRFAVQSNPLIPGNGGEEIDDDIKNNDLFQQFMAREGLDADGNPIEPADGTDPVGEGSVAPSASPTDDLQTDPNAEVDDEDQEEGQDEQELTQAQVHALSGYKAGDTEYTPEQMEQLFQLASWAGSLNPTQAAFIDAVLSGQIPQDQIQSLLVPQLANTPQAPAAPEPLIPDPTSLDPDYEPVDPIMAQQLAQMREAINQQNLLLQQQLAAQQQTQSATIEQQIMAGAQQFQTQYQLTDEERETLINDAVIAQVLPGIAKSIPDPSLGIQKAMEIAYWQNPTFRQRAIQSEIQQTTQQQTNAAVRKSKASVLAGGGGSVPRNNAPAPMTKQDRQKAMAAEIAASMEGN